MTDNNIYKYYKDLPSWAKGIVVVGGLAVTYIVGNTIYKKIKDLSASADAQVKLNQIDADLSNKLNQGQQPTFDSTQYNNFADSIASAFSGCDYTSPIIDIPTKYFSWSNSGIVVYNILNQFNNDVDFLALQKAFGVRTITKPIVCGGDYKDATLNSAVTQQLDNNEIISLNNLLSDKGISHRF